MVSPAPFKAFRWALRPSRDFPPNVHMLTTPTGRPGQRHRLYGGGFRMGTPHDW